MITLAIDLGDKRTGLAACDKEELIASPCGTITEENKDKLVKAIAEKVHEIGAEHIVIGLPKNMDGTEGESANKARIFKDKLSAICNIDISLVDERCTTMLAHNYLNSTNTRGKKRKAVIDTVSAVVILEDYLQRRKLSEG